ncbi:MAG: SMC-Scp complex subunit ScpB, partial [Mycoplasmataceae bacterium]|nr:SMC-Scp complex subunit ScpB [Mycoplasmataceae bacterium]
MNNYNLIESLMYIQGEEGLSPSILKDVLGLSVPDARKELKAFLKEYNAKKDTGLFVIEYNENYKLATKPEFKDAISKMVTIEKKRKLSGSAIETAGIIAYKQPITKSQINMIRGVASEGVVHTLLIKGIIEEKGVSDTPGNPILYGITDKFYDYFNIT